MGVLAVSLLLEWICLLLIDPDTAGKGRLLHKRHQCLGSTSHREGQSGALSSGKWWFVLAGGRGCSEDLRQQLTNLCRRMFSEL